MEISGTPSQALYKKIVDDTYFAKALSTMDWQRVQTLNDPSIGYKELDISLMYTIIKHYKYWFVKPPTRNWGSNPQKNEVSIGDDVERIHRARNDYLHQIKTNVTGQKLTDFFDVFIDVGKRVDAHMKKTTELSYAKKILTFKTCYIDDRMAREAIESSRIVESKQAWFVVPTADNSNAVHVYRGIELTKCIEERKQLPDTEKIPLLCIFPDIKDEDANAKAQILNDFRDEINKNLVSIKLGKAEVGSIILVLEIENKVLHHARKFEQELRILISNVVKYLKVDFTDMIYMIVTMPEGWHLSDDVTEQCSDEESHRGNSLNLTLEVENSILHASDGFEQNMKHFFEVIASKTNKSYDGSAIIAPIQKVHKEQCNTTSSLVNFSEREKHKSLREKQPTKKSMNWEFFDDKELEAVRKMVEQTGIRNLPDYIAQKFVEWKKVTINISVVGETYVGKSTFINKMRGVEEWDECYAPVGLGDTTLEPTPYKNPYNENMIFWDLPGVGTLRFPKDDSYFKTINVDQHDFFLIMSDACFSENDAWIARELRKQGKPFFFVRTKLDEALASAEHDGQSIDEVIPRIYQSCCDNLRKAKFREPIMFVISNYDHEIGQFDDLINAIFDTLPDQKREAMVLSLGPLTHQIIREKKRTLHNRIFGIGIISAGAAAVQFPGVDIAVDLGIIAYEITFYMKEFGLDKESLQHLCKKSKTKYDQVIESLKHAKCFLTEKSTIRSLFMRAIKTEAADALAGRFANYLPVIGAIVSSVVSYGACVHFLQQEVSLLEEDAHTLIDLVLKKNAK